MSGRILASIVDIVVSEIVAHLLSSGVVCAVQKDGNSFGGGM